jgi:hypothetical protein
MMARPRRPLARGALLLLLLLLLRCAGIYDDNIGFPFLTAE